MSNRTGQQSKREVQREAMARGVIQANSHLNFVQRALNPQSWPKVDNEDGSYSTHRMGWSEDDQGPFVYPTIVFDEQTKSLRKMEPMEAARHAIESGELIRFDSPDDADWFSNHGYKIGSGMEQQVPSGAFEPVPIQPAPADPMGGLMTNRWQAPPKRGLGGLAE